MPLMHPRLNSPSPVLDSALSDRPPSSSRTSSAVIASVVPLLAFIYFFGLYLLYKYASQHPKPVNNTSGVRVQRYGPAVYMFMVLSSLAETAIAAWLLVQFNLNSNYPNSKTYSGVKTLLFSGCWTTVTAGCYTVLFLHPVWSKYSISSIGAQAVWILVTWFIWVAVASA